MNEEMILKMISQNVYDNRIDKNDFEDIFSFVSEEELEIITQIVNRNNIVIVQDLERNIDINDLDILEEFDSDYLDEDKTKENKSYIDELFRDKNTDSNFVISRKDVKQSNEVLCVLIQEGNEQAKSDLCIKNSGLVAKSVKRYNTYFAHRLTEEDLMTVGYLGLLKAADRYDISLGYAFSTYATWWINQQIVREIFDQGFSVRIPVHMMEKISKITTLESKYMTMFSNHEDVVKQIALDIGESPSKVVEALNYREQYLRFRSLDVPVGNDGDTSLLELYETSVAYMDPVEETEKELLREKLEEVLLELTSREEKVLRLRFGLDDGKTRTLEEVGREFNVTRERIRQIEAKALRKLKHPSRSSRLKDFLNKGVGIK